MTDTTHTPATDTRGEALPTDVRRLVIAARKVMDAEADADSLHELDNAAEAFATRVRWEDDPTDDEIDCIILRAQMKHDAALTRDPLPAEGVRDAKVRKALLRMMAANAALGQFESGLTLYERSPTKWQKCFEAWTELDAAGKEARAALKIPMKLHFTAEWLRQKIMELPDEAEFEVGPSHYDAPIARPAPDARDAALEKTLRSVADQLEGGFIRCEKCGEQQDTKDMDIAYEIRDALQSPAPPVSADREFQTHADEALESAKDSIRKGARRTDHRFKLDAATPADEAVSDEYHPRTRERLIEILRGQAENPRSWQAEAAVMLSTFTLAGSTPCSK